MNQINPLHIGALLGVVILFLFFQLSSAKEELKVADREYKSSEKLAVDLSSLKSVYADKKKTKKALERILSQSLIKQAKLTIQREKKSIKVSSKSVQTKVINLLMGKLLNGSYNIKSLKIKKLSETKASLSMEIKL
jgi:hypothetical protein